MCVLFVQQFDSLFSVNVSEIDYGGTTQSDEISGGYH